MYKGEKLLSWFKRTFLYPIKPNTSHFFQYEQGTARANTSHHFNHGLLSSVVESFHIGL